MAISTKSFAGVGKPALIPREISGRSSVTLDNIENISREQLEFSNKLDIRFVICFHKSTLIVKYIYN